VADNLLAICNRGDLSELVESMLGDCCGPGSAFDQMRQHLSSYTWDHHGDLDPDEPVDEPRPGAMLRSLEVGRELAGSVSSGAVPSGPIIDVGCSVGRSSFALAQGSNELVLGVDLNFAMLRVASEVLRHGKVRYPRRRSGVVYDRRGFPAEFVNRENVDFWACDAAALPLPSNTFSLAVSMNVLDCAYAPSELLATLARVLQQGGKAVLTCPYDWSPAATPLEAWLGGHSQRSPLGGSSEAVLRTLLTRADESNPAGGPNSFCGLELIAQQEQLPWSVRLHDRSAMGYKVHLIVAAKSAADRT